MFSIKKYGPLVALLVLMGCTQKTPSEYIEEANQAILDNKLETAVIVLKSALSSDPQNVRARFLLGSVYYQKGNVQSAEKELKIAYEGGYFKNEVIPIYLGTMDFLRMDDEIIRLVDGLTGLNNETEAAAQTYKGLALFRKQEMSRAKLAIKRASELAPDSSYSRMGRAYHALNDGELTDALIILDELLQEEPDFMEAVLLQGQLSLQQGDYETAAVALKRYVSQKPGDAQGNFLLIDTLIRDEKYDAAESILNPLLAKLPDNPQLNEFSGILKFNKEDFVGAKRDMENAISGGSNAVVPRLIAGVSAYQQQQFEQAHKHLASVAGRLPSTHPAKRLFAEIQLRLGYSSEAAETLRNLGSYDLSDVRLFTQAGLDLSAQGDTSSAQKMLQLAKSNTALSVDEKTRIGVLKISLNDDSGIQDLIEVLQVDPTAKQARLMLTQRYVGRKEFDKAVEVAKAWTEVSPQELTAFNLLAEVYQVAGQEDLATQTHEAALKLAPNNPLSLAFMAEAAKQSGDENQALAMLKRAAENNPEYLDGALNYFVEARSLGESFGKEALTFIKDVHQQDSNNVLKALNYARALVIDKQPQLTVDVLTAIDPQKDMPLFYWKAQADSHLAMNKPNAAIEVYTNWQQLEPNRKESWLSAIVILDSIRDMPKALDTVKRAQNFHPDDEQFRVMEVHYSLLNGNISVAQRLLDGLSSTAKNSSLVKGIQGQIYFYEGKFADALPLLKQRYEASRQGRFAMMIADASTKLNSPEEGISFLQAHLDQVPNDMNIRAILAERLMETKPKEAISHYEYLLNLLPENIVALNNLAWLYAEQGELTKAIDYADAAVALRPNNPKLLDTLGVALLKAGQNARALEVSKKAFDLERSNQTYRIHYEQAQKANQ